MDHVAVAFELLHSQRFKGPTRNHYIAHKGNGILIGRFALQIVELDNHPAKQDLGNEQ